MAASTDRCAQGVDVAVDYPTDDGLRFMALTGVPSGNKFATASARPTRPDSNASTSVTLDDQCSCNRRCRDRACSGTINEMIDGYGNTCSVRAI